MHFSDGIRWSKATCPGSDPGHVLSAHRLCVKEARRLWTRFVSTAWAGWPSDRLELMPRPPRIQLPGGTFHVTSRGNRQQPIFVTSGDHIFFLDLVRRVAKRYAWRCLGYCLMPNHYHLILTIPTPSLSPGIQLLNGRYAQTFNQHHAMTGHLFQGRFHSLHVERHSHLLELCRYLALNPVRGGLCRSPGEWLWSSYRATVGLERPPSFLCVDEILEQFSRDEAAAVQAFQSFVKDGLEAAPSATAGVRPRSWLD
jgi:putative transposase